MMMMMMIIIITRNAQSLVSTPVPDTQDHARQEAYSVLRRKPTQHEALHTSAQTRIMSRDCQVYGRGELKQTSVARK